jgi:hypothetical protein
MSNKLVGYLLDLSALAMWAGFCLMVFAALGQLV